MGSEGLGGKMESFGDGKRQIRDVSFSLGGRGEGDGGEGVTLLNRPSN